MTAAEFFLEEDQDRHAVWPPLEVLNPSRLDEHGKLDYWATLAMRHCHGLGQRTQAKILKRYGSAYAALEDKSNWPALLNIPQKIIAEIENGAWRKGAKAEWDQAKKLSCGILLWNCGLYPQRLRELADAPILLYCLGDTQLLLAPAIAIVGSRNASGQGLEMAAHIARELSSCGIAIVSGMANGIDSAAHAAALGRIGKSIGALGTGIDRAYPAANSRLFKKMAESGLLLSEFAPQTPPAAGNFPVRNRIISGMSLGVVVVEAATRSGSLITARLALEQNREVFAVPGPAMTSLSLGCQDLIRQGAHPVFSVDDILRELAGELRPFQISHPERVAFPNPDGQRQVQKTKEKPASQDGGGGSGIVRAAVSAEVENAAKKLTSGQAPAQVMDFLTINGITHVDALSTLLAMPVGELNSILLGLEMTGKIKRLPGARFEALQ